MSAPRWDREEMREGENMLVCFWKEYIEIVEYVVPEVIYVWGEVYMHRFKILLFKTKIVYKIYIRGSEK